MDISGPMLLSKKPNLPSKLIEVSATLFGPLPNKTQSNSLIRRNDGPATLKPIKTKNPLSNLVLQEPNSLISTTTPLLSAPPSSQISSNPILQVLWRKPLTQVKPNHSLET